MGNTLITPIFVVFIVLVAVLTVVMIGAVVIVYSGRRLRQQTQTQANNNDGEVHGWLYRVTLGDLNNYAWLTMVTLTTVAFFVAVFSNNTPFVVMLMQSISGNPVTGSWAPWICYNILVIVTFSFTFLAFSDEVRRALRKAVDLYDQRIQRFKLGGVEKPEVIISGTSAPMGKARSELSLLERFLPIELAGEVIGEFLISLAKGIFTRFGG